MCSWLARFGILPFLSRNREEALTHAKTVRWQVRFLILPGNAGVGMPLRAPGLAAGHAQRHGATLELRVGFVVDDPGEPNGIFSQGTAIPTTDRSHGPSPFLRLMVVGSSLSKQAMLIEPV